MAKPNMLAALVLALSPTIDATVPAFLGGAANGWFLEQVGRKAPDLSVALHADERYKPFTLSPLWSPSSQHRGNGQVLRRGEICYLRITSLQGALTDYLLNHLAPSWVDTTTQLCAVPFHVKGATSLASQHPRAAHISYEALSKRTQQSPPPQYVALRFLTPTTFRRSPPPDGPCAHGPYNVPLPEPELVFDRPMKVWNKFSPQPLPGEVRPDARGCAVVSSYELHTEVVEFGGGGRGRVGGFVGRCRFALRCKDETWRRRIGLLAAFVPFAGVGWRTTMGLGQTQLDP